MPGAIDLDACTRRRRTRGGFPGACLCKPPCAVCGHGPHMAVHGPCDGQLPGSAPWGHEYQAQATAPDPREDRKEFRK